MPASNFAPPPTNISDPNTFGVLQAALPQALAGTERGNSGCGSIFETTGGIAFVRSTKSAGVQPALHIWRSASLATASR